MNFTKTPKQLSILRKQTALMLAENTEMNGRFTQMLKQSALMLAENTEMRKQTALMLAENTEIRK